MDPHWEDFYNSDTQKMDTSMENFVVFVKSGSGDQLIEREETRNSRLWLPEATSAYNFLQSENVQLEQ